MLVALGLSGKTTFHFSLTGEVKGRWHHRVLASDHCGLTAQGGGQHGSTSIPEYPGTQEGRGTHYDPARHLKTSGQRQGAQASVLVCNTQSGKEVRQEFLDLLLSLTLRVAFREQSLQATRFFLTKISPRTSLKPLSGSSGSLRISESHVAITYVAGEKEVCLYKKISRDETGWVTPASGLIKRRSFWLSCSVGNTRRL